MLKFTNACRSIASYQADWIIFFNFVVKSIVGVIGVVADIPENVNYTKVPTTRYEYNWCGGSGGIRPHASEEPGASNQPLEKSMLSFKGTIGRLVFMP